MSLASIPLLVSHTDHIVAPPASINDYNSNENLDYNLKFPSLTKLKDNELFQINANLLEKIKSSPNSQFSSSDITSIEKIISNLSELSFLQQDILSLNTRLSSIDLGTDEILSQERLISELSDCRLQVNKRIREVANLIIDKNTSLSSDKQSNTVVGSFFIFVVVLIIGFFFNAIQRDKNLKTALFSDSDRGLQFITIFLLVSAIVLFGIIGVLLDKELSALLGGLSGYILGRSKDIQAYRQSKNGSSEIQDVDTLDS